MTTRGPSNPGPDPLPPAGNAARPPRISDEAIDAFFDRELDPRRSRDLLLGLTNDHPRSEEVARTQRMLSLLRRTPLHAERAEEDMLGAIMARVDRRRRFLPESWRRFVTAGRLSVAATFLLAGFGVAVLGRTHPDLMRLAPHPAPIAALVDTGRTEATESAARCVVAFEAITDQAAAPILQFKGCVASPGAVPTALSEPLRPGLLATVRFADSDTALHVPTGSGEASLTSFDSLSFGLELAASRQRSGSLAPVFVPAFRPDAGVRVIGRAATVSEAAGVDTSTFGPVSCQSLTIGDHTVVVSTTLDGGLHSAVPFASRRLLLIPASPSDQFPSR